MPRALCLSTLAVALLPLAGCGDRAGASVPSAENGGVLLLKAGGSSGTRSATFEIKGRGVRVVYTMSRVPAGGRATFAFELDRGAEQTPEIARVTRTIGASSLKGDFESPVVAGRYRLRVDSDAPWAAEIYDMTSPRSRP